MNLSLETVTYCGLTFNPSGNLLALPLNYFQNLIISTTFNAIIGRHTGLVKIPLVASIIVLCALILESP